MRNEEHLNARALMHWWAITAPRLGVNSRLLAAIPNGGHRHIRTAMKMKAEGVQAGMPDYFLFVPRRQFHGLAIELKAPKTGRMSEHQKEIRALLEGQGYEFCVAFGWDEARIAIEKYLGAR